MEKLTSEKVETIMKLSHSAVKTNEVYQQVFDELYRYKKLEEELGCPFEVRCKLVDGVEVYTVIGEHCVIKKVYEDSIRVYVIDPDACIETDSYMTYKISDYKKLWWLKKDRSE